MAQYTIEDIEILRQKSGISYEEAVNLLDYHNGSLARALVDLEKNGRIRDTKGASAKSGKQSNNFFAVMYRTRFIVTKGDTTIINLSALFMLFVLLAAVWVLIIGGICCLALGYRFSVQRDSKDFSTDNFEDIMRNAGNNIKNTVSSFAGDMKDASKNEESAPKAEEQPRSESAASGTTPVNVQFPDGGSVNVRDDNEGFHEAEIR